MTRFLSIGECMIEMAPETDGTYSMGFAGDTFNTAWYARRIAGSAIEVQYLSAVGDDEPSARMTHFMKDAGVIPRLRVRKGGTVGLYMISLNNGERSFSYWRSASAARSLADDLEAPLGLKAGDMAFFSGITMAILPDPERLLTVLRSLRAAGITVVFDPNLRPRLWQDEATMCDWIMKAAAVSDICLPSFEDEQGHFGDADPAATASRYSDVGATTIVVKDGAGPVLVRTPEADATVTPELATSVVDTTAAGDSFNAGFLMALLDGKPLTEAVFTGCELARKVIAARGALVEV